MTHPLAVSRIPQQCICTNIIAPTLDVIRKKYTRKNSRYGSESAKKQSREGRKISAKNSRHKGKSKMHATRTEDTMKRSRARLFVRAHVIGKTNCRPKNSQIDVVSTPKLKILPKSTYLRKERTTEGFLKLCWFLLLFHLQENTDKKLRNDFNVESRIARLAFLIDLFHVILTVLVSYKTGYLITLD